MLKLGLRLTDTYAPEAGSKETTVLRREANGTVTVVRLGAVTGLNLNRQSNGAVSVS